MQNSVYVTMATAYRVGISGSYTHWYWTIQYHKQDHTLQELLTCYLGNTTAEENMSNILICCLGNKLY